MRPMKNVPQACHITLLNISFLLGESGIGSFLRTFTSKILWICDLEIP